MNIYRLGLLLQATNRVEADVSSRLDATTPEAIADFRMELYRYFEKDAPWVKRVVKQLEAGTCKIK